MAGWSNLSELSLDRGEASDKLNRGRLDIDSNSQNRTNPNEVFDYILTTFFSKKKENRPFPVMISDGQVVDLFQLYWVVRERGGYESVTRNELWGKVAEWAGLGSGVGSAVELVYVKYLYVLDHWLQDLLRLKGVTMDNPENLASLDLGQLELDIDGLITEADHKEEGGSQNGYIEIGRNFARDDHSTVSNGAEVAECNGVADACINGVDVDGVTDLCTSGSIGNGVHSSCINTKNDDEKRTLDTEAIRLDTGTIPHSLKRKSGEESLMGMLSWVKSVAKCSWDTSLIDLTEDSKRNSVGIDELTQAVIARELLLLKRQELSSEYKFFQQKRQRMHPSMYEDCSRINPYGLRCGTRLLSPNSSLLSSGASVSSECDSDKLPPVHVVHPPKRVLRPFASLNTEVVIGLFCKDQLRKRVPLGKSFQAAVPAWSEESHNSYNEIKWLGTRQWPIERQQPEENLNDVGRGRSDFCECKPPGSVYCVRFHVAEKRDILKHNLGPAFYDWSFHCMGEEVSLTWSEDEERMFKTLVRVNPPSLGRSFWEPVLRSFHYRTWSDLVSYYFNVFLLRRRCYQNRVTPYNVDSDDDESDFGFLGNNPEILDDNKHDIGLCSENKQFVLVE